MDIIQEQFSDPENLEEASSLSRMIQALNPKLLNKKGKDSFYAFKYVYRDIYVALLSEFLRSFLHVEDLNKDCTPNNIQKIDCDDEQQVAFSSLVRAFIIKTHPDFKKCSETADINNKLPPYYPHQDFVRHKYSLAKESEKEESSEPEEEEKEPERKIRQKKASKATKAPKVKTDGKNSYAMS